MNRTRAERLREILELIREERARRDRLDELVQALAGLRLVGNMGRARTMMKAVKKVGDGLTT